MNFGLNEYLFNIDSINSLAIEIYILVLLSFVASLTALIFVRLYAVQLTVWLAIHRRIQVHKT